eukprot:CAMPEP_0204030318 /NCGR_PEP_ID=MMETSP0360-20130528/58875_1 /ASSEMBLY_ACC=CAM_ASM_000342 /TAXON_ID=268821 /ORGANISM="Scrippsiella Hangoei, Strain SHTV-5" /LENGTH=122 /DNA_ID=CAMNT_0050974385 /DNA_START=53 /DNA_END=418 /DNA_ORIENTATION=+
MPISHDGSQKKPGDAGSTSNAQALVVVNFGWVVGEGSAVVEVCAAGLVVVGSVGAVVEGISAIEVQVEVKAAASVVESAGAVVPASSEVEVAASVVCGSAGTCFEGESAIEVEAASVVESAR